MLDPHILDLGQVTCVAILHVSSGVMFHFRAILASLTLSAIFNSTKFQEQYLSEGSTLGTWDNSMKSVLCFGEDYSNYIRRKSELPSLENISIGVCGLEVRLLIIHWRALNACLENCA